MKIKFFFKLKGDIKNGRKSYYLAFSKKDL